MSVVFSAHIARVGWSLSGTVVASPRMIGARTRPAICSSWLIQPLLQVAQTALTVVWNGLLVWRYSLDRFSHPDPAAAGWPVRTMRSSQSGSTCSLVIVPLAPQKTQAVAMPGSLHHRDPSYARARSSGSRARPTRPTTVLGGRVRVAQGSTVPFRRIPFIPEPRRLGPPRLSRGQHRSGNRTSRCPDRRPCSANVRPYRGGVRGSRDRGTEQRRAGQVRRSEGDRELAPDDRGRDAGDGEELTGHRSAAPRRRRSVGDDLTFVSRVWLHRIRRRTHGTRVRTERPRSSPERVAAWVSRPSTRCGTRASP